MHYNLKNICGSIENVSNIEPINIGVSCQLSVFFLWPQLRREIALFERFAILAEICLSLDLLTLGYS